MKYISLTYLIQDHVFTGEEFWQILPVDNAIVFRTFSGVYIYEDNKISIVEPDFVVNHMVIHKDRILVAGGVNGLSYVEEGKL